MRFIILIVVSVVTLVAAQGGPPGIGGPPGPGGPCTKDGLLGKEFTNSCENKCETSCANMGEDVDPAFVANNSIGCVYDCYCRDGDIRDDNGDCVKQESDTCDFDPCEDYPNTVWRRCALNEGPTCYFRPYECRLQDYKQSRCVCKPGYSLNLNLDCIKTNSKACRKLGGFKGVTRCF